MKHTMITFRLHRSGVLLIAAGSFLVAILLFAAGYLAGGRGGGRLSAPPLGSVPKPKLASIIPRRGTPAAPPAAHANAPAPPAAAPQEMLALRVAMFVSEAEARTLLQELTARKIEGAIIPVPTSTATLYTVQVGRYASRDEASSAAALLLRDQGLSGVIVPAGLDAMEAPATK
jgi:hypothetical protein